MPYPSIPAAANWGHLGVRSIAQFALMNPATYALQQVAVDQGNGSVVSYMSSGTAWERLGGGGVVKLSSGVDGLVGTTGKEYPLTFLSGTPHEPTIAGVVNQIFTIDAGSDVNHADILFTFNATTADPDTEDSALASLRFVNVGTNAEVIDTNIVGASGGSVFAYLVPCTLIHFALAGGGSYTTAAGNVCTGTQMVLMKFASALAIALVEIRIGTAYVGAGSNKRYRQITVTGYAN